MLKTCPFRRSFSRSSRVSSSHSDSGRTGTRGCFNLISCPVVGARERTRLAGGGFLHVFTRPYAAGVSKRTPVARGPAKEISVFDTKVELHERRPARFRIHPQD